MREVFDLLDAAIQKARLACATSPPSEKDVAYHFGRLQGVHSGLLQATKIIENFLNEQDVNQDNA